MRGARAAALACAAALVGTPAEVRADGAYGRFEGDLLLTAGAGASVAEGGPRLATLGRALFLSSAGPYVAYDDTLGHGDARLRQKLGAGVTLAPLFPARFASNAERGPAWLDLLIDSFCIETGVAWTASGERGLGGTPGLELGVGVSIPLGAWSTGFFLDTRATALFSDAAMRAESRGSDTHAEAALTLTLAYHGIVSTHLVDPKDRRPE